MASTKSTGSTKLGRDSASKRLGIKKNHGEAVKPGEIIIRQRGSKFLVGVGVAQGADDTLYAKKAGTVMIASTKKTRFDRNVRYAKIVKIVTPSAK